jgi:hypothetical protein
MTILCTRNPFSSSGGVSPWKSTAPRSYWIKSVPVLSLAKECHLPQTLFPPHRAGLRRLDQALHLFPRRASPVRNGRSRGRGLSHPPGRQGKCRCFDTEPGPQRPSLPLSRGAPPGPVPRGRPARQTPQMTAHRPDQRRDATPHRLPVGHTAVDGQADLRQRHTPDGVSTPAW